MNSFTQCWKEGRREGTGEQETYGTDPDNFTGSSFLSLCICLFLSFFFFLSTFLLYLCRKKLFTQSWIPPACFCLCSFCFYSLFGPLASFLCICLFHLFSFFLFFSICFSISVGSAEIDQNNMLHIEGLAAERKLISWSVSLCSHFLQKETDWN